MKENLFPSEIEISQFFFGSIPFSVTPIPKSGSSRTYFRLSSPGGKSAILCRSDNIEENEVFIRLCQAFYHRGINVPEILATAPDLKSYLQTDLGSLSLFSLVTEKKRDDAGNECLGPEARSLVMKTLDGLVQMQSLPSCVWEPKVGFPPLGSELIAWDFKYFMNQFVNPANVDFNLSAVEGDLSRLGSRLESYPEEVAGFMFRDFQSRNVMIRLEGADACMSASPYFIDFQSGRRGPCVYDLVSFVWQAKAAYTDDERKAFISRYVECYSSEKGVDEELLYKNIPYWALFRVMQVLGAYGLRGLKEGKQHFIDSIPYAVKNLHSLLNSDELKGFPAMRSLSEKLFHKYHAV